MKTYIISRFQMSGMNGGLTEPAPIRDAYDRINIFVICERES